MNKTIPILIVAAAVLTGCNKQESSLSASTNAPTSMSDSAVTNAVMTNTPDSPINSPATNMPPR